MVLIMMMVKMINSTNHVWFRQVNDAVLNEVATNCRTLRHLDRAHQLVISSSLPFPFSPWCTHE